MAVGDSRALVASDGFGGGGVSSSDGAGRIKISAATADTSTSDKSCRKLEAFKGSSSIAHVDYS